MARCLVSNPKKLRKIRALIGQDFVKVMYRGGHWDEKDGHWFEVYFKDGSTMWVDSKLTKCGSFEEEFKYGSLTEDRVGHGHNAN